MHGIAMAIIGLTYIIAMKLNKISVLIQGKYVESTKRQKQIEITIGLLWLAATLYVIFFGA